MRRIVPAILLVAALAIGGGLLVNAAYDAGVNTAVTTAVDNGAQVAPVVVPPYAYGGGYGYGWHPFGWGFSIFGLLFGLFFLFIIFGLIRAIFWGGHRGWGPNGWGGGAGPRGRGWDARYDRNPWIERFGASFEEWHRQAHGSGPTPGSSTEPPATNQGSTPA
ncbi:MAG: hypothetical protein HY262_12290 [Chloroflexi bacterium]|nr:hypothetical protein [Chloroflexota bacterium]